MNCTRARSEIALWAGGDVDDRDAAQLERHVALCAECREYRRRMVGSVQMLQEPAFPVAYNLQESVWPNVEARLSVQSRVEARRAERLNRRLPAVAVAVACLAVIALTSEPEQRYRDVYGQSLPSDRLIRLSLQPPDQPFVGRQEAVDGFGLPTVRPLTRYDIYYAGSQERGQISHDDLFLIMSRSLAEQFAPNRRSGRD